MTYHPDDPRHDARAILRRLEEFEVIYEDVFDNVRGSILHMQRHIAEAMPAFALMERAGIGSAYGDIDMDEFTALLIMDADGVAHEVAQAAAENSATGCADDLLDAARIASDETVRIMKEKAK